MIKEKTEKKQLQKKKEKQDEKEKEEKKVVETKEKIEAKPEEKKGEKAEEKKSKEEVKPKNKAIVRGMSLKISSKHCFAICKMLKGKSPDKAIEILENVVRKKRSVPMRGREVAHQKGKGMAGGKFPKKAALEIINLLKQLKANATVNGIENAVITTAKADKASRPYRRAGRRAKRTHVYLEVKDKTKLTKKGKE